MVVQGIAEQGSKMFASLERWIANERIESTSFHEYLWKLQRPVESAVNTRLPKPCSRLLFQLISRKILELVLNFCQHPVECCFQLVSVLRPPGRCQEHVGGIP